jgi:hypothetical protein
MGRTIDEFTATKIKSGHATASLFKDISSGDLRRVSFALREVSRLSKFLGK